MNMNYLQRAIMNDNAQYIMLCIFMVNQYPLSILLISFALYSLLAIAGHLSNNVSRNIPASYQSIYRSYIDPYVTKLLSQQQVILNYAAYFEVVSFPILIFNLFTYVEFSLIFLILVDSGYGGIMAVLGFYWFLSFRYLTNNYTQNVFYALRIQLDNIFYHPKCPPVIGNVYTKVKTFLSNSSRNMYRTA